MYDIIKALIDHTYETQYAGDQQYIYYIVGAMILLFSVVFIDLIYRVLRSIFYKGGNF